MFLTIPSKGARLHFARRSLSIVTGLAVLAAAAACSDTSLQAERGITRPERPVSHDYSPGDPSSPYGIDIPIVDLENGVRADQILSQMAAAGAMYVRLDTYWGELQSGGPGYLSELPLNTLRSAVARVLAYQMIPVVVVQGVPNWAITNPNNAPMSNYAGAPTYDHLSDWQAFISLLVNDPGLTGVTYWAIQNEPNTLMTVVPGQSRLETYKYLVQYAATPIHQAGDKLLGPETIGTFGLVDPTSGTDAAAWLADVVRNVGYLIDVVTVHDYQNQSITIEQDMKILADSAGGNRELWLTEAATAEKTPSSYVQRIHVREVLQRMSDAHTRTDPAARNPYWTKTFWWNATSATYADSRGLLDGNLFQKEAYYCYRGIAKPSAGMPSNCFNYLP